MSHRSVRVLWVAVLLLFFHAAVSALEVPHLTGRVNDLADLLPATDEARIEAALTRFEERTGAQIVILTVPSLEGDALELFTHRVAETWGLGREGVNDGVLFFVARDDRKMRIEIGYGLESSLTDLQSSRILNEIVRPHFQSGDYPGGLEAGVEAILTAVDGGDPLPRPGPTAPGSSSNAPPAHMVFFFSLFTLTSAGALGWILAPILALAWWAVGNAALGPPGGIAFAAVWIVLFLVVRKMGKAMGGPRGGSGWSSRSGGWGGFSGGSYSGGRSSGGGFSGGGFSGGGGSFGGGGSSSGW